MIIEAVGISANTISQGAEAKARTAKIQAAMEQAVADVLAEGINDPDERARIMKDRISAAREKAKAT